ncbi:uncharacterized protein LOC117289479 [Asterias rubens]|uniref:uncharacterized protein LOC117289479 n=1 Tax=Asterias rubens TaxID=7604 RepID=UPI0014552A8C|nr:uncharacterized protein LOC117289479 [Asterias rubens]
MFPTSVYMQSECGHTVTSHGDIIYSQASLYYQPRANCTLTLLAPHPGQKIRLQFVDIDIKSDESCQSNHLTVGDGESVSQVFCGQQPPVDVISSGEWLQLNFKSDGVQSRSGRGFQMVFTLIYQDLRCAGHHLFHCGNGDCISSTLRCDTVDHCGDGSDEAQHGTCEDDESTPTATPELTLTTILFGSIALLITACFFVGIISQCFIHINNICKKCRRPETFQRGDAAWTECQPRESMARLLDITQLEVNEHDEKNVDANLNRMEKETSQKPLENEKNGQTFGRFTIHKVQHTEDADKCNHVNNRGDAEPSKDGGMTDETPRNMSIGRFNVQRVDNAGIDVVPVSMINLTDSMKRIPRRKVGFVLKPGVAEITRRESKVKFVFHSDPVPPSPSSSTSSKRSILKKNPKYPDYQNYESKLNSSYFGSTDDSSDEDVFISDYSDESIDERLRDVEEFLDTPRRQDSDLTTQDQVLNVEEFLDTPRRHYSGLKDTTEDQVLNVEEVLDAPRSHGSDLKDTMENQVPHVEEVLDTPGSHRSDLKDTTGNQFPNVDEVLHTPRSHGSDLKDTMENQFPVNTDITIHDNPLTPEVEIRCLLQSQGTNSNDIYNSNIQMKLLHEKSSLDVAPYGFTVKKQNNGAGKHGPEVNHIQL